MSTREQILDAITTAAGAVAGVGAVLDAASLDAQRIAETLAAGEHVAELLIGDDGQDGVDQVIGFESYSFPVVVIVHLAPSQVTDAVPPRTLACRVYAAFYTAFMGASGVGETWGGLAQRTHRPSGGGVVIDEQLGTMQTAFACEVDYRHPEGTP